MVRRRLTPLVQNTEYWPLALAFAYLGAYGLGLDFHSSAPQLLAFVVLTGVDLHYISILYETLAFSLPVLWGWQGTRVAIAIIGVPVLVMNSFTVYQSLINENVSGITGVNAAMVIAQFYIILYLTSQLEGCREALSHYLHQSEMKTANDQ